MLSRDFVYWLQGFFEVSGVTSVDEKQVAIIKQHLDLVFEKESGKSKKNNNPLISLDGASVAFNHDPNTTLIC